MCVAVDVDVPEPSGLQGLMGEGDNFVTPSEAISLVSTTKYSPSEFFIPFILIIVVVATDQYLTSREAFNI
jgi:hypothetical protein